MRAASKRHYARNRERIIAATTRWNKAHPEERRLGYIKTKYGLTPAQYHHLWKMQNGCCAICGVNEALAIGARLHVDHNHVTKRVRGLLCSYCNAGLGHYKGNLVA